MNCHHVTSAGSVFILLSHLAWVTSTDTQASEAPDAPGCVRDIIHQRLREIIPNGSSRLCGIYSACIALHLLGHEIDPSRFVTARYVSSIKGSTAQNVVSLLQDAGVYATCVDKLSVLDIYDLNRPVIANVRSSPYIPTFDHWVVARVSGSSIVIQDGPAPPVRVNAAEFAGMWNGVAIMFANDRIMASKLVFSGGRLSIVLLWVLIAACFRWMFSRNVQSRHPMCVELAGCALLLMSIVAVTSTFIALFCHGDVTFSSSGRRISVAPFTRPELPSVSINSVGTGKQDCDSLLIDARYARDFAHGAVPGAINIPADVSIWSLSAIMSGIPRGIPITIYCQTEQCDFDEIVAKNLFVLGFESISICRDGWRDYVGTSARG